ncbi:hypothetical protein [Ralstonia syzygii]|uniref:hypothetical protein n=1 Tax=Ralstonia syzygii TaxID=28097 RepID=UPI0018D08006|nr:hypothetical protein [Ralstonia syzygii]
MGSIEGPADPLDAAEKTYGQWSKTPPGSTAEHASGSSLLMCSLLHMLRMVVS